VDTNSYSGLEKRCLVGGASRVSKRTPAALKL
jgi:hypothetical protein